MKELQSFEDHVKFAHAHVVTDWVKNIMGQLIYQLKWDREDKTLWFSQGGVESWFRDLLLGLGVWRVSVIIGGKGILDYWSFLLFDN